MLDGRKADSHGAGLDNTRRLGKVHMRRKQTHALSREIRRDGPQWIVTAVVIEDGAGEASRKMSLQISGLPGNMGITRGVRFIEGIGGEPLQNLPDSGRFIRS